MHEQPVGQMHGPSLHVAVQQPPIMHASQPFVQPPPPPLVAVVVAMVVVTVLVVTVLVVTVLLLTAEVTTVVPAPPAPSGRMR